MKRAALFVATALALIVPLVWFGGCVSTPLPAAEVDSRTPAPRLDLRVGVEASRVKPFSEELVHALRASGFFAEVDLVDRMRQPPDLVAKVEHGWQGAAVIPFFTVLTLGLVPTIAEETYPRWIAYFRHELERASAELAPLASAAAIPARAPR